VRLRRCVLGTILVAAVTAPGAAGAAVPTPFATLSGVCPAGQQSAFSAAPVATTHSDVVVRYAVTSGAPHFEGTTMSAGDVRWYPRGSAVAANSAPGVSVWNCSYSPSAFQVGFYDLPAAPVTYSGVGSSDLPFRYNGQAQYVADLQLSAGAAAL